VVFPPTTADQAVSITVAAPPFERVICLAAPGEISTAAFFQSCPQSNLTSGFITKRRLTVAKISNFNEQF